MKRLFPKKSNSRRFYVVFFIVGITIVMVFYVWEKVRIGLLVSEIDELRKQEIQLQEENYVLRAKVIDLSSYENITRRAQEKLGMIFPQRETIYIPDEKKR
ncbi:MAG: cell division protein FtsL [candidate division KSB1 bacterium]|nr:cell division protein FtsL [candidate division KSB1 bacterium]